jgi:hypothetical protein
MVKTAHQIYTVELGVPHAKPSLGWISYLSLLTVAIVPGCFA